MTSTVSRRAKAAASPSLAPPAGPDSLSAETLAAPTAAAPAGPISRAAEAASIPSMATLREPNSHATDGSSMPSGSTSRGDYSRPAIGVAPSTAVSPDGAQLAAHQRNHETQAGLVGSDQQGRDRAATAPAAPEPHSLLDPALSLAADFLDDIERVRTANENRLRSLTRVGTDADGVDRYIGLEGDHPVVAQLAVMVKALRCGAVARKDCGCLEHDAERTLTALLRKHPLGPWMKAQKGIGPKQGARLLASIGDPYWRPEIVREDGTVIPEGPRTVSALWAYCGLHVLPAVGQRAADDHASYAGGGDSSTGGDSSQAPGDAQDGLAGVAARRRKGQQANWSTKAKTRAYLIAESCLKQLVKPCHTPTDAPTAHLDDCSCSPYRLEYDRRKAHTSVSRPEWTDGHRHADALRVASKAILRDLWRAGRDWHLAQKESS